MIEIEKAKQEIIKHVTQQKIDHPRISKKLAHIMRVAQISKEIGTKLKLSKEQIQIAELIGVLHDIGRFEQYKIFDKNTTSIQLDNAKKFNHGEAGVEVLKKNNYIRKYIKEDKFDEIIYTAIYEHNRYEISKGLNEEKELFCKIIKDADKIDLIYEAVKIYWQEPEKIKEIEEGQLSEKMLQDFVQYKLADNRNRISETDQILRFTSFIFDINFQYSFKILKENDNINKMIDRFNYRLPKTRESMEKVKKIANEYLMERK